MRTVIAPALITLGGISACSVDLDLPPDNLVPEVVFDNPKNGTSVSGVVGVEVSAFDNSSVERVQIFIDGTLRGTFYVRPYFVQWNVQNLQNGSTHTLRAEAIDRSNNKGTAEITVTVSSGVAAP